MPISSGAFTRRMLLVFAGVASLAMLIAAIALLIWVKGSGKPNQPSPPVSPVAIDDPKPAAPSSTPNSSSTNQNPTIARTGKRFSLRLGQGFRFKDGAVVVGSNQDEHPDVVFRYVPPQVGGAVTRYNPISQQVESGLVSTITQPIPILVSTHINVFEQKPNVAAITSGDAVIYGHEAAVASKTRYVLLQNTDGDQYLLTLDELEAVAGKYDDWRIGCTYEKVQLPMGLAGGHINRPLPGKIIFRDWYR